MTTVTRAPTLTMTRRFDASPERLFDTWTDPHLAARWLFTGPESTDHAVEMDVRVGGAWKITDSRGGVLYTAIGEYLEIDRPRRLAFSFGMPQFSPGFATVTVDIVADGAGAVMTFTQTLGSPAEDAPTREGWKWMFVGLEQRLTQGGYGTRLDGATIRFERLFPGPIERLWAYLTDPELRGRWFAAGAMELQPGGRMELRFQHAKLAPVHVDPPARYAATQAGVSVVGRVLVAEPPRRLAFAWGETDDADQALFELTPEGDRVRLVLTHSKLKTPADRANVAAGWHTHLAILSDVAAGRAPTPFWAMWRGVEEEYAARLAD